MQAEPPEPGIGSTRRAGPARAITLDEPCVGEQSGATDLQITRFQQLGDGKQLVRSWFRRGWLDRDKQDHECFEPFIITWIALNGWAECVTELESDAKWVKALAADRELQLSFSGLQEDPAILRQIRLFAEYWPVPKMQHLRRHPDLQQSWASNRDSAPAFAAAGIEIDPRCALRHWAAGDGIPLDWSHCLRALYRVRCNLFHGEKSLHRPDDQALVASSFRVLVHAMKRWPDFAEIE